VSISPDERFGISGSDDHSMCLWDFKTGKCLQHFTGHIGWISWACITPNGRFMISHSNEWEDRTLRIWKTKTGECLHVIKVDSPDSFVRVTVDSRFVIDNSRNIVNVWEIETGELVSVCFTKNPQMTASFFHPDEKQTIIPCRLWRYGGNGLSGKWDEQISATCKKCGGRFPVAEKILDVIKAINRTANLSRDQSPCLELPDEAWDDPRLLSECPLCHKPLKFNPFIVDNRDRY